MTRKGKKKGPRPSAETTERKAPQREQRPPQAEPSVEAAAEHEPGPSRVVQPSSDRPKEDVAHLAEERPRQKEPSPVSIASISKKEQKKPAAQTETTISESKKTEKLPQALLPKTPQGIGAGDGKGARPKVKATAKGTVQEIAKEVETKLRIAEDSALRAIHGRPFPKKQTGSGGRPIRLIANYFATTIPHGYVYHYDVDIHPYREMESESLATRPQPKPKQLLRRRFPAWLCRKIIDKMVSQYQNILKTYPAYDGNKNLYTREPLPFKPRSEPKSFIVAIEEDDGKLTKFTVVIKPALKEDGTNAVNLDPLHQLASGYSAEILEEAVLALDIILRHGPSLKFVPVSRSFFLKPRSQDEVPLGEGREIWFGYYQSLRPGWKPFENTTRFFVNIDKVATSFYKAQPILRHVTEVLHLPGLPARFTDAQVKRLTNEMKNLKVEVTHLPYRRKYTVVKVTQKMANQITFEDGGHTTDIATYFRTQKNRPLRYPHYPCLQVKPENRNICLPLEVCDLADNQPCNRSPTDEETAIMVKNCAIPPRNRFFEIERSAKQMKINNQLILKQFDIDVDLKPLQLDGRVLDPPKVEYANKQTSMPRDGQWEVARGGFQRGAEISSWIIINFCRAPDTHDLHRLAGELCKVANKNGMRMADVTDVVMIREQKAEVMIEIHKHHKQLQFILVVLGKNDRLYKHIKKVSETDMGVVTQCLTDANARRCQDPKFASRFLMQLCQKINAKTGGKNNQLPSDMKPSEFGRPIMVIGADVSHPAPSGDNDRYSIAAVAGSMDSGPSQYMATVELQRTETQVKSREERILNLEVMVIRLLKEFHRRVNKLPETIIYYRDGVSEGQFGPVRDFEIQQLRRACNTFDAGDNPYQPKMTFIIVQKRHHTRFVPENIQRDGVGRAGNVPPGTIVDTDVTHPSFFDWFLCSHLGIQGTSRPAHYSVVWDDNDFTANTLQKMSFYLCHTSTRCTKSVSIPPPVVYADLMAYRAKLYINSVRSEETGSASSVSSDSSGILPADVEAALVLNDRIKNSMFFV